MSEYTPWDEGDAKAVFDCLKYHAAAGGEYEYRGTLAIEAFTRICAEIARLRAEREELRQALGGVIDFAEDWHAHYSELWGCRRKDQQDAMLAAILKARAALAEKGE